MRYPSGKSVGFGILIWGVMFILVASLVLTILIPVPYTEIILIGTLIGIAFMLWVWFGTYYEFKDYYILLRMGPFIEKIPYERITSVKMLKSMASSMALSNEMIELRHGKNYITGTTYISPEDRDGFLAEVNTHCPDLKTDGAAHAIR